MLVNNLSKKVSERRDLLEEAVAEVIESGFFVLGPKVKGFEDEFAKYLNIKHCVGLANGTDAIELALRALEIGRGDKVITVANAGMYTTTAILAIGAEPLFVDVDIDSKNICCSELERFFTKDVKAVVVTHLYGLAVPEIKEIANLCKRHHKALVEDCAQAHGALVDGQRVGTFGDVASFSFYPTKNLGALGDGGAVVTTDSKIAERVRQLRQYGWSSKYEIEVNGGRNSRLDEIQAAVLSVFLPDLDLLNARRREIVAKYSAMITHSGVTPPALLGEEYVAHLCVVRSEGRNSLREHLKRNGIATEIHYPIPDYKQQVFGERYINVCLPNTELLSKEILTLPCYPEMSDAEVDSVIDKVNSW